MFKRMFCIMGWHHCQCTVVENRTKDRACIMDWYSHLDGEALHLCFMIGSFGATKKSFGNTRMSKAKACTHSGVCSVVVLMENVSLGRVFSQMVTGQLRCRWH